MKYKRYLKITALALMTACILEGCKDPTYPDIDAPDPNRSGTNDIIAFEFNFSLSDYPDYREGDKSVMTVYPEKDSIHVLVPWYAETIMAPVIAVPEGATVQPVSGSVHDFSLGTMTYTVRAENGEKRVWKVYVEWEVEPEPLPRNPEPRRPLENDNPKYPLVKFNLWGNAYSSGSGASRGGGNTSNPGGGYITNTSNPGTEAAVNTIQFVVRHTGELQMAMRGRAGNANGTTVNVRAFVNGQPAQKEDGDGDYNYSYPFNKTNQNTDTLTLHRLILPEIPDGQVGHSIKLEIRAEGARSGSYHFRFYEMWVSGWAIRGEKGNMYEGKLTGVNFANSTARDGLAAPSIHMDMTSPAGNMEYFYVEVTVPDGYDPLHNYWMTSGNSLGYAGIQTNLSNNVYERRFLFSVWSSAIENQDSDPIIEKYRPKLVRVCNQPEYKDRITYAIFTGEGTGRQSRIDVDWETGKTYKVLTRIRPHPDQGRFPNSTLLKAWFHNGEEWMFMCEWRRQEKQREDNGNQAPAGPYYYQRASHFLEDFNGQMGYAARMAYYHNHYFITDKGEYVEPVGYVFTGDQAYGRADVAGGVITDGQYANSIFLKSGGYFTNYQSLMGSNPFTKPFPAVKPELDLEALNAMGTDDPADHPSITPGEQYTE